MFEIRGQVSVGQLFHLGSSLDPSSPVSSSVNWGNNITLYEQVYQNNKQTQPNTEKQPRNSSTTISIINNLLFIYSFIHSTNACTNKALSFVLSTAMSLKLYKDQGANS